MIFEKLWEFSNAQAMPNAGSSTCTYCVDTTASAYDEWNNMAVPLWLVVTCNTVGAGTSIVISIYQHSTTTVTSGDLLLTGPIVLTANLSANAKNDGHYLLMVPVQTIMAAAEIMGGQERYWGPVMTGAGDMSAGKIDAYLLATAHPMMPTTQVNTSNI